MGKRITIEVDDLTAEVLNRIAKECGVTVEALLDNAARREIDSYFALVEGSVRTDFAGIRKAVRELTSRVPTSWPWGGKAPASFAAAKRAALSRGKRMAREFAAAGITL